MARPRAAPHLLRRRGNNACFVQRGKAVFAVPRTRTRRVKVGRPQPWAGVSPGGAFQDNRAPLADRHERSVDSRVKGHRTGVHRPPSHPPATGTAVSKHATCDLGPSVASRARATKLFVGEGPERQRDRSVGPGQTLTLDKKGTDVYSLSTGDFQNRITEIECFFSW